MEKDATGVEPCLLGGFGGVIAAGAPPLSIGDRAPSFALQGLVGYRLFAPLDVGLHVFHQWQEVVGLPAGASAYSSAAGGGAFARIHPLAIFSDVTWIDPSVGAGFDLFAYERQDTRFAGASRSLRSARSGAALPVIAAVDVPIFEALSVSGVGIWGPWWNGETCASQGNGVPACGPTTEPATSYFFVGVGLRLHLRFVD